MSIFPKRTPGASAPKTDAPTGGDLQAQRRRNAAIEKEAAALAEATADRRAAVQQLKAEHAAAHAAAQTAQRDYAAALAHRAVSKAPTGAPPAPGQALAHAQGLASAISVAEGMATDAEAAEAPARARLADARDALHYGEWMAARAAVEGGIAALLPALAGLRSATLRCQAPWIVPELGERLRAFDHAQGTAEPLGGR